MTAPSPATLEREPVYSMDEAALRLGKSRRWLQCLLWEPSRPAAAFALFLPRMWRSLAASLAGDEDRSVEIIGLIAWSEVSGRIGRQEDILIVNDLETTVCAKCGCYFGVPSGFLNHRREDKGSFYCPNGHSLSYNESEADKLRRERDRLTQRLAQKDDEIKRRQELLEGTERQLHATRGVVTRIKNRVGTGVCPCCNRTFENLHRHMTSKHPTYAAEAAE